MTIVLSRKTIFLLLLLGILSACIILFAPSYLFQIIRFVPNPKLEKNLALNEAQMKWNLQNISSYRMTVAYKSKQYGQDAGVCREEIEVNNYSATLNSPPCNRQSFPINIPTLLNQIGHDINTVRWNQCQVLVINATYDPELGYPRSIQYKWEWARRSKLRTRLLCSISLYRFGYVPSRCG